MTPILTTICIKRSGVFLSRSVSSSHLQSQKEWTQTAPKLRNPYKDDVHLRRCLQKYIPENEFTNISADLIRFGDRIVTEIDDLGRKCEENPPSLIQFDGWGNRVDALITSSAWKDMKRISAEEGLVAIGYEPATARTFARLHQFAKLYLYSPSSGLYTCPLAMTDGAAKVLMALKLHECGETKDAFSRLTSRDPGKFWTSGQWMTEKCGGSDVGSATQTIAQSEGDDKYKLYGYKWFASATDAHMTLTLARTVNKENNFVEGSEGLSLYYAPVICDDGQYNGIEIVRLKNKLGTRQLPTAELILNGTLATKISPKGKGISCISHMLNMTRLHNACSSVAAMRSRDYMHRRKVFGEYLVDNPLHMSTISQLEVETRGCTLLLFHCVHLLGLEEQGVANPMDVMQLRILTTVLKLYSAKMAVQVVQEGIESFGGQGYIEETGLPTIIRDAHVLPIWEGTTNVLAAHNITHFDKESELTVASLRALVNELLKGSDNDRAPGSLAVAGHYIKLSLDSVCNFVLENQEVLPMAARDLSYSIARISIGALMVDHALYSGRQTDVDSAIRWCYEHKMDQLRSPRAYEYEVIKANKSILCDEWTFDS